jgi:hypothetical protein
MVVERILTQLFVAYSSTPLYLGLAFPLSTFRPRTDLRL